MYGEAQDTIITGTPVYQGRRWSALDENRSTQGQRGVVGGRTIGRSNTVSRESRRRVNLIVELKAASPIVPSAIDVSRVGDQSTRTSDEAANSR